MTSESQKINELQEALQVERSRTSYLSQYFDNILEAMPLAIIITDDELFITAVNSQTTDFFGVSAGSVEGAPLQELVGLSIFKDFDLDAVPVEDLNGFQEEIEIKTPEKEASLHLLVSLSVLRFENGDIEGCICIAKDMTNRKRLEASLTQAQKLESVGQLAAGVAHEINTPIQYVRDNMLFLRDEFSNILQLINLIGEHGADGLSSQLKTAIADADLEFVQQEIPPAIEQTLEGAEAVAAIVRSMKAFSHPGSDNQAPVDINAAIENTCTVSRNEWKYVANLELDFEEDLPLVMGFAGEINQALLNLIVNSAHAMNERVPDDETEVKKGTIEIKTKSSASAVQIIIKDTGSGIPKEIISRIFDPFFTTKEVGKGTGQGLTFVYNTIVDTHGGSIDVESEPGKGTNFYISLPRS